MDGEVSPDTVRSLLNSTTAVRIVDIRRPQSYSRGHIPGSENIPFEELPTRVSDLAGAEQIVTVCPHGEASVQAAKLIGSYEGCADTRVVSMAGGLEAWSREYDVEAEASGESPF